jgi:hypothetical protein
MYTADCAWLISRLDAYVTSSSGILRTSMLQVAAVIEGFAPTQFPQECLFREAVPL